MKRSFPLPVFVLFFSAIAVAVERPSDGEIKALVAENMRATQAGNVKAILATVHSESPAQANIPMLAEQFAAYKLRYSAPSASFICMSGEYALIRVLQQTVRVDGPPFLDNELDGIWALKSEGGKWKYWTQMGLTVRPLPSN